MTEPGNSDPIDATSIRIIEAGYRSINDPAAFDDLVAAWKSRIDAVRDGSAKRLLTPALERHCDELIRLLDTFQNTLHFNEHDTFVRQALGPAFVVSASGTIIALNEDAATHFGLAVGQRSDFDFLSHESEAVLRTMRDACSNRGNARRAILRTEDDDERLLLLDAQMISAASSSDPAIGLKLIGFDWNDAVHDLMMLAFDLSDAEAQVVGSLYKHADLSSVAAARGTSVRTVRTQLHQVFEKTGVSGQVELVRMVSLICAQENSRNSPLASWRDPLDREQFFLDKSGRKVCWTWMGCEDGEPALLCHGPLTGHILLPEIQSELAAAGIKLYAIVRPGFGHSDPGDNDAAHLDGASAIVAMVHHLGLQGVTAVGLVNGIIPLLFANRQEPGLFKDLLCVGSSTPIALLDQDSLPQLQSTIFRLAASSNEAFEAFVRTGYRAVMSGGPEYFLSRMYDGSPADQRILQNQDVFALLKASTAMVATQGHRAFYSDMIMSMLDFSELMQGADNIAMLSGTADPVYDFDAVMAFGQSANVEIVPVDGAGQTVCHSHPTQTAQAIIEAVQGR